MSRLLEMAIRWLCEALVRLYYPVRSIEGAERIPRQGPVVFVLNHPNGLLDPMVLRVSTGRGARFLAKSTLFGNPAAMRTHGEKNAPIRFQLVPSRGATQAQASRDVFDGHFAKYEIRGHAAFFRTRVNTSTSAINGARLATISTGRKE